MAKQVKSIRFDEDLMKLFSDYSELNAELFGSSISLASVLNIALAEYLKDVITDCAGAMAAKSVVDILPNGILKKIEFTDEQIAKMQQLSQAALSVWFKITKPFDY